MTERQTIYAVLSIGCIECGDENDEALVGVYRTRREAEREVQRLKETVTWQTPQKHWQGFNTSSWQVRIQEAELQ